MSDASPLKPLNPAAGPRPALTNAARLAYRAAFWVTAALVFTAAAIAALAPQAAGLGGLVLLLGLAGAGLVFLYIVSAKDRAARWLPWIAPGENIGPMTIETAAFENMPDPAFITDAEGAPAIANRAFKVLCAEAGIFGDTARPPGFDRLLGAHPAIGAAIFRLARAARRGERHSEKLPAAPFGLDQDVRRFALDVTPLTDDRALWRAAPLDVREDQPGEADASTESLLDDAPMGFFCAASDGKVAYLNATLREWLGPLSERPDLRVGHFVAGEGARAVLGARKDRGPSRAEVTLKARDGVSAPAVIVSAWPDGDPQGLSRSVVYARAGGGAPVGVAQALAAPAAPHLAATLDAMFANAPFGVVRLDGEHVATAIVGDANPAFFEATEGRGGPGVKFADLFAFDDDDQRRRFNAGEADAHSPVTARLVQEGGEARHVHVYFAPDPPSRLTAYVVDVTERKALEDQLFHSQRMRAIGDLAAGVAHDMNNKLTAIQNAADMLLRRHPAGDPSYSLLKDQEQNVARAAALVRQLLAFARQEMVQPEVIEVPSFVASTAVWLRQLMDKGVTVETDLKRTPAIKMGRSQLESVVMNLATNARDAMKGAGDDGAVTAHGVVRIRTGQATDEEKAEAKVPADDRRDYAVIEVSDTGSGIPREILDKVFDPFFTTKKAGEGTGLGLSTVFGATSQAGGRVAVDSAPGQGATFRILLPAADAAEAAAAEAAEIEAARQRDADRKVAETDDLSGTERILFVEDEAPGRRFAVRMLQKQGYDVLEAANGQDALDLLEENDGGVDLMVSDVMMPGMDGVTLLREAKTKLGDAAVIFISGYPAQEFSDVLEENPSVRFLSKPYKLDALARTVKAALAARDEARQKMFADLGEQA